MKGIILAGGTGSRLYPLTKVTNKHLLPVGKYPMIFHAIFKLKQAGIEDILVVTGKEHMGDVVNLLGSGSSLNVSFTYKVQDEAGGIAQALGLAEQFVGSDQCVVILGDNVFDEDISQYVRNFEAQGEGAKILIQKVSDPQRFGVPELQDNRIISIEEKPETPKSNFAVTGIYMFDSNVFNIIKTLTPSNRGELEITDVNNAYIKKSQLTYDVLGGWWTDAGTHASLARANELAKDILFDEIFGKLKL
ncbi:MULTISPECIES: sugar phosphate nucleotidyltransferase [unclassified Paenibacillus]|uniref:sugar phosphate nucleotidyltransferase n=1 Tax=unclassified Paenibacillus TaxID=185978 RepID=UPI002405944E|nr:MULTISPECIES: sugar phosphate nucleotidyltransferase [unclassified Paenibacillus]MDF9840214.1 glucose-1-phosphate thymidylyltransferase [Paenibacillus sp. PastF-2]MDF9846796.1 glucose-1-phosphate thymidylyltransferase [Paenibacillus sp. PastM-2]MDF9852855.1 glucose-1-phosphate thymidylyltransferase [Paenibacillus sp. PastF-1]MDH6478640.1 glucose-1-phosphate thymidylyltransferase [Paenibacillus sp. PastH-2]MDH6505862.1 glucose-1-phosphate thymidylyltransferase [Paenibacillus sp. PastM-3]